MKKPIILYQEQKIIIEDTRQIHFFSWDEIISFVYSAPYVEILTRSKKVLLYISLSNVYDNLPDYFILCNRSTIVNINYVNHYDKQKKILQLTNGDKHSVSIRKKTDIEKKLVSAL